jgi:hypothetical protein
VLLASAAYPVWDELLEQALVAAALGGHLTATQVLVAHGMSPGSEAINEALIAAVSNDRESSLVGHAVIVMKKVSFFLQRHQKCWSELVFII